MLMVLSDALNFSTLSYLENIFGLEYNLVIDIGEAFYSA